MYIKEELQKKTKEELKEIASGLGIAKISALKKAEICDEICKRQNADVSEKKPDEKTAKAVRPARVQLESKRQENSANAEAREMKNSLDENAAEKRKKERPSDAIEVKGILDVMADEFGFLRFENFSPSEKDVYVSPTQIRRFNLKTGDEIVGDCRPSAVEDKYSPLLYIKKINGDPIDVALKRRPFERLTPIYPTERLCLETADRKKTAARIIDLFSPIGKGQRGMIVAPPKAGKTTILKQLASSVSENYPDVTLIILLIDERPEEVTDIKRSVNNAEVVYSTFDQSPENHCRLAELVLERAMRLVEQKKDCVILLDSITRLARAYNLVVTPTGRTLSGGLDPDALFKPKKFFGAARNIEEGGSLTIIATALVETGSRMDDVIFEEFKGTGNMEIKLDRSLQERRIFPAIDIQKSGTRREEELLPREYREAAWIVREQIGKSPNPIDTTARFIQYLCAAKNNEEFMEVIFRNYRNK